VNIPGNTLDIPRVIPYTVLMTSLGIYRDRKSMEYPVSSLGMHRDDLGYSLGM